MKRTLTILLRLASLTVLVTTAIVTPGSAATFQGLGYVPSGTVASFASAISADGQVVVGSSWSSTSSTPFRWTAATGMVSLGSASGEANAVSSDGSVVVGTAHGQAFRWTASDGVVDIGGLPGSFFTEAYGVSADGSTVVGRSESFQRSEAFRWTAGGGMSQFEELSGADQQSRAYAVSADGSAVVGWRSTSSGMQAFRGTDSGGVGFLPDGEAMTEAYAVSADGSVVVGRSEIGAVRWTASDGLQPLHVSGSPWSVSPDGSVVVGEGLFGAGHYEAFIWTERLGTQILTDMLGSVVPEGWGLYRATGVAVNGNTVSVVGHGSRPGGADEAWMATFTVPEPSSLLVLGVALLGFGTVVRRRTRTP